MATDDIEARQRRLERRQAMADALMAQSMQAPQGQMVSGHYVAPSPFEYLAKAGQQFLGNRAQRNLDESQSGLDAERRQMMAQALQGYLSNRQQDPYAAAAQGAASDSPLVQRLALDELKELNKPETWKSGGTRRDPNTGELVEVLISNRGNERASGYGAAPKMSVAGGEAYDPYNLQPGQKVGRDPSILTPYQMEQLRIQQEQLQSINRLRDQQIASAEQKRQTEVAKEADRIASDIASADASISLIDDLINHPGRGRAVGLSSLVPSIPGGAAKDYELKLEQLKGSQYLQGVQQMRGLGQLSNQEGAALLRAATSLDSAQSEEEHEKELRRIKNILETARKRKPGTFAPSTGGVAAPAPAEPARVGRFMIEAAD